MAAARRRCSIPNRSDEIIDAASRVCGIEDDAEITLEANPGTVDLAKLAGMRAAGVNRISFGAQSFNAATLKFLGRIHSADETRAAANMAHRAGFDRLNLDLIFAVPGQTVADVLFDIESVAALEPDHISAYNLTFEEGTAFFTDLKRGRIKQLATDEQAAMYQAVREEIPRRGYAMYEISNYAAPGHEARHNLTYWRGADVPRNRRGRAQLRGRRSRRAAMVEREAAGALHRRDRRARERRGRRRNDRRGHRARRIRVPESAPARRLRAGRFSRSLRPQLRMHLRRRRHALAQPRLADDRARPHLA